MGLTHELARLSGGQVGDKFVRGRTITHGSLGRGVWKISWPICVTTLCLSVVDLVHVQVAGFLSSGSQAIIGICDQILMLSVLVITSLSTAITALVSKSAGAGNRSELATVIAHTLRATMIAGVVLMLAIVLLAPLVLPAFSGCVSNCDATLSDGLRYIAMAAAYLVPFAFVCAINAAFTGIGNSKVQLLTLGVMAVVDVALCYVLVVAGWPVKGMGITGIAAASIVAYCAAGLVAVAKLVNSELRITIWQLVEPGTSIARSLMRSGLPPAAQEIAWASSTFVLFWLLSLSQAPSEAVAAWTIGQRLEAFALLPLTSMGIAILVMVGQNVSSGRAQRAWKVSWTVAGIAAALMVAAGALMFFLAHALAGAANPTPETRPLVVTYLQVIALGLPFAAMETVLTGSLQALDDTRVPMVVGLLCNWGITLPMTYVLAIAMGYGPVGAWIAIVMSTVASGLLVLMRFRGRPEWRTVPVTAGVVVPELIAGDGSSTTAAPTERRVSASHPCIEMEKPIQGPRDCQPSTPDPRGSDDLPLRGGHD
jgi:putative MATE family efflux protein